MLAGVFVCGGAHERCLTFFLPAFSHRVRFRSCLFDYYHYCKRKIKKTNVQHLYVQWGHYSSALALHVFIALRTRWCLLSVYYFLFHTATNCSREAVKKASGTGGCIKIVLYSFNRLFWQKAKKGYQTHNRNK
uniref:Uncharacterized protein n=1 Tax=Trypanosoma congolense (strain IL3000) TaxID=1068625 RepID=G0ULI8_TRYCI|nr:hypothetical protein, unlikely [Trypanosoma congolense IL3000]